MNKPGNVKKIDIVIGKNFGDEGKGQTVSLLAKQAANGSVNQSTNQSASEIVIRHNGGAQAGHTVEFEDFRFIFHELSSASHLGVPTYWASTFMPDMIKLSDEIEDLNNVLLASANKILNQSRIDTVYASNDCMCVTVYDILLNSLTESLRAKSDNTRHGSCGMGIFEAVKRNKEECYRLYLKDFSHPLGVKHIIDKLSLIRKEWVNASLLALQRSYDAKLFQDTKISSWIELIDSDDILTNTANIMYENFCRYITPLSENELFNKYDHIIFENAQGLMLDQANNAYYPHLTPSNTGLTNPANIINELLKQANNSLDLSINVYYVSRSYQTRHGAGRLDYECDKALINSNMYDQTNVPNPWQESLRYAKFKSIDEFISGIINDLDIWNSILEAQLNPNVNLLITHLNETDNNIMFKNGAIPFTEFVPKVHESFKASDYELRIGLIERQNTKNVIDQILI